MVERIEITVRASGAHPDVLTVQDAMQQVLDIFRLLASDHGEGVMWKLVSASTNSPFHLEGEAVAEGPNIDVAAVAQRQKASLSAGLRAIESGEIYERWRTDSSKKKTVEQLLRRNLNGIGRTDIDFKDNSPAVIITPARAENGMRALSRKTPHEELYSFVAQKEHGSFEGVLQELSAHHNRPAVSVKDRKSGRVVWCHLSLKLQQELSSRANYEDFWRHHRVIVRGSVHRNSDGAITLVEAIDIERLISKEVSTAEITDQKFTAGLPVSEYLERFREGTLDR